MHTIRKIYSTGQRVAAVGMILALLWLTVSAPFVFLSQKQSVDYHKMADDSPAQSGGEEDNSGPYGNSTEEKSSSSGSFSEEFLHDHHLNHPTFSRSLRYHKCADDGTYNAFHGELLVPPPNAA